MAGEFRWQFPRPAAIVLLCAALLVLAPSAGAQGSATLPAAGPATLDESVRALDATRAEIQQLEARLGTLAVDQAVAELGLADLTASGRATDDEITDIEEALRSAAVDAFMGSAEDADRMIAGSDAEGSERAARRAELSAAGTEVLLARRVELHADRAGIDDRVAALTEDLRRLQDEAEAVRTALADAHATGERLAARVIELAESARLARLGVDARLINLPGAAKDAYVRAGAVLAAEDPACGVAWWHLAAIGQAESGHGSVGGRTLLEDARSSRPIFGIPLDGNAVLADGGGIARITDTDGGALDGDPEHDRAVGPMQFLPSTWARWQADGDGDGAADPQDLDDAALTAARYLCHGERDLGNEPDLRAAVLSYNRSSTYAARVIALAAAYERSAAVTG